MKRSKIVQLGLSALISVWIAGSLSVTALRCLGAPEAIGQALLTCALAALFGVLVSLGRVPAIITGAVTAGAGIWLGVRSWDAVRDALMQLAEQDAAGMPLLQGGLPVVPVVLALAVVWTLFLFGSTHTSAGGFLSMVIVMLYWLLLRSVAGAIEVPMMLVTLVGVAALFAVPVGGMSNYIKALLPTAVLAALLAVLLLPAEGTTFKPLEDAADRVRSVFNSYFSFTDTRVPYSISMDGYHPLGETLGGPAEPNEWPVMEVATEQNLYLRGTIRRTYVNTAWTDAVASSRYLFKDGMKQGVRAGVFESERVDADDSMGAFIPAEAEVELLTSGTSTLFVPHRLTSLRTPLELAAYYNTVGDVFITRDVQAGDSYAVEAVIPSGDGTAMRDYVEAHRTDADPLYPQAVAEFTQLPDHIEAGVYALTAEVTDGALTDWQTAKAIENHLKQNYSYTLDVAMPRSDRDFVSEFLLGSKEGYCSYFATAMAVMGRIAGLPTRYVEGYRVEAMPMGVSVVTGENAHAWVEVYMNGVGWVTFDPTPSRVTDMTGDEAQTDAGEATAAPTEEPQGDMPADEPTPEPTDVPEEPAEEPLEGTENPSAEPTVTPEPPEENPFDTPTQPPEFPDDMPEDEPQDAPDDHSRLKPLLIALAVLLLIVLLCVMAYLRLKMSDPRLVAMRCHGTPLLQMMVYYRAILTLLEMQGQVPESGESPVAFARRLVRAGIAERSLLDMANRLSYGQYAGKGASDADVAQAAKVYAALAKQLRPMEKLRWHWTRIRRGMGSVEQIP